MGSDRSKFTREEKLKALMGVVIVVGIFAFLEWRGANRRKEGAAKLGNVAITRSMTYAQLKQLLGEPQSVEKSGIGATRIKNGIDVTWYGSLIDARFVSPFGEPVASDCPIQMSVSKPFNGTLDGRRIHGSCGESLLPVDSAGSSYSSFKCDDSGVWGRDARKLTAYDAAWHVVEGEK
jgi:hypothetical protein